TRYDESVRSLSVVRLRFESASVPGPRHLLSRATWRGHSLTARRGPQGTALIISRSPRRLHWSFQVGITPMHGTTRRSIERPRGCYPNAPTPPRIFHSREAHCPWRSATLYRAD